MKKLSKIQFLISLMLLMTLLSPVATLGAFDGKKSFKKGMKHEAAEEWDKAVEEFAIAVAENPRNPEYRLHLVRSLFNASQMYMQRGSLAAKSEDYQGAYVAFRRAYGFDPTNELARSEMERMVRLQRTVNGGELAGVSGTDQVRIVQAGGATGEAVPMPLPQRLEKLRDILFPAGIPLETIIKDLSRDLDLNVLFDVESFRQARSTKIELRGVTAAQALDYIFLQEGLFFQKVGPRTIVVATQQHRQRFQQLVLRTFYLANASPKDIDKVVKTAIPAQPGRAQTIVLMDEATNSVTIRDTEANIQLIGQLIKSLDKDRAEVVMDVAIYEVNKNDLIQFGNQLGTAGASGSLLNIGGVGFPTVGSGPSGPISGGLPFVGTSALSIALGLPISNISALQSKSDTKLIASTQIHAFNNEDSSARIGQRVPVRSATFQGLGNTGTVGGSGVVSDVINYEQVGLTLKFKPIVFPNQDVQVAMEIESKDVSGASTLTPTFTERSIKGTARVQNNKTLLLASVAQGVETKGRQGLPLIGLIPILGRLFTAPTRDNRQVDVVIAITPRVIRAPAILPEDEIERQTGSIAVPTNSSLEAMLIQDERNEMLAAARRNTNNAVVQLPDRPVDTPEFVPGTTSTGTVNASTTAVARPAETSVSQPAGGRIPELRPIDTGVRTLKLTETSLRSEPENVSLPVDTGKEAMPSQPVVDIRLVTNELKEMKAGESFRIPVMITGDGIFSSALMGLKFDDKRLVVRNIYYGEAFGEIDRTEPATPFLNQNGKTYVSLTARNGKAAAANGVFAYIEIEALADGIPSISFEREVLNFLSPEGKNFLIRIEE